MSRQRGDGAEQVLDLGLSDIAGDKDEARAAVATGPGFEFDRAVRDVLHRMHHDRAAAAWQSVLRNIGAALEVTNSGPRARAVALNKFWGDHQRFFRQVICAFKVPSVIAETEAALSEGKSVVISLVGTGEARTKEQVAKATANGGML